MKRIDTSDRAVALFGAGKDGFKEQVPGVSLATQVDAQWFNMVQEAVVRTIEAAGIALSDADFDQFTAAVQAIANSAATAKVNAVVAAAPGTLDTLNELAAALADDPNFATTMTNALASKERKFDSGTLMLFPQSVAPVGWTKSVTHNNKALRVVSGAAGSGGSVDFTTAFAPASSTAGHVLTVAEMPSHTHSDGTFTQLMKAPYVGSITGNDATNSGSEQAVGPGDGGPMLAIGGGTAHSHSINLDVKYVDVIIASKD